MVLNIRIFWSYFNGGHKMEYQTCWACFNISHAKLNVSHAKLTFHKLNSIFHTLHSTIQGWTLTSWLLPGLLNLLLRCCDFCSCTLGIDSCERMRRIPLPRGGWGTSPAHCLIRATLLGLRINSWYDSGGLVEVQSKSTFWQPRLSVSFRLTSPTSNMFVEGYCTA